MNLLQLFQAQKKWTTDKSVQQGVFAWFVDWSIVLVVAVCISGNSFGAIELANVKYLIIILLLLLIIYNCLHFCLHLVKFIWS